MTPNRTVINAALEKKRKKNWFSRLKKNIADHPMLYLMILPVIIYYILFHFLPMYGVVIAFKRYVPTKGIWGSNWVGLKHFNSFFKDYYFGRLLTNTLLINFYNLIFGFPVPIIFALALNELRSKRFKKLTQTVTYMPHFVSAVVMCGIVADFTKSDGLITTILSSAFGFEPYNLLGKAENFRSIFTIMNIWQGFGWGSIIYIAALTSTDQELYEAAAIDGAGRWKQTLHISIPSIMPTIVIMLILRIGQMMNLGWEKIYLLYSPLTYETADVISTYVYRRGMLQSDYSYGAAVGLFNSVVNCVLIILANTVSRKVNETSMW